MNVSENNERNVHPPKWAAWLLDRFCTEYSREEVQGDLEELFIERVKTLGEKEAKRRYVRDVMSLINPLSRKIKSVRKREKSSKLTHRPFFFQDLLKHFLVLGYRNSRKFKGSFFINLTGLSTGLACVILILLWVKSELNIGRNNKNDSRIFQVLQNLNHRDGTIETIEPTPGLLAEALLRERPEFEYTTSVIPSQWFGDEGILTIDDTRLTAKPQFVGKNYFDIFTCEFIRGDKKALFTGNNNIAISEEMAFKIFNSTNDIIGRTITWHHSDFDGEYQVTGVFKNQPANSNEKFDLIFNYDLFLAKRPGLLNWSNSDPSTFVLLRKNTQMAGLDDMIKNFLRSKQKETKNTLFLQKYSDRYLFNNYENGQVSGGRIEYVRLFSIIAVFILLIACINFMNLSTARASARMKEVGIKKAIGAGRNGIIFQFLAESLSITFISLILSVGLVLLFLPGFNEIVGRRLSFSPDNKMIFSLVGLTVFTGLVAGSYPALYLSGFKPSLVLKGKLKGSIGELWARKGLVVFQFSLSMILIVSVLVVYRQVAFVQSKNLGFNRENIIHFQMQVDGKTDDKFFETGGELQQKLETYLREIKEIPGVISATNAGGHNLTGDHGEFSGIDWREGNDDEKMGFANLETGYNFIETLNIRLLEGRGFSRNHTNEESKVIFNEKAIQLMGLKDPVGKKVTFWGGEKEIIGVVKDFHFESLYKQIKPCVIRLEPRGNTMLVKLPAEKQSEVIARLHKFQQSRNPGLAFNYKFIDEDYQELYVAEKRVSVLSKYFAAIAIIISCLGLFGLAVFTAQRRRKEIGIRKILGSGELGVIRLLSAEFMQMILTAVIIAMPLSYMAVSGWLSNFAYTTPLNWWLFAGAGVVTLIIGWLAVAAQTLSAARINPIQTIREE